MWGRGKRLEATNYSNFGDSIQMSWAISLGQRFVTSVYQAGVIMLLCKASIKRFHFIITHSLQDAFRLQCE